MDNIKEAFQKVKQDIDFLNSEMNELKKTLIDVNNYLASLGQNVTNLIKNQEQDRLQIQKIIQNMQKDTSTHRHINQTNTTHPSTHNTSFKALKPQILPISTGNQGVPTDRQTDRQTDRHIENVQKTPENSFLQPLLFKPNSQANKQEINPIENAAEMLESLDSLKKEIRLKFKRLTEKELLVFSTLYQLDEEFGYTDYKTLSKRLNLTESSIRDYIGRLINKGVPVDKNKLNNKNIQLSISNNLKKIASLPTILKLREI